jgi:hypothetical protein
MNQRGVQPKSFLKSSLDVYTGPVPPNSRWHDERAVRDKCRIHYAKLDPAVGSTRLLAVARKARVGFAKTLGALDCPGKSGLEVSLGRPQSHFAVPSSERSL